MNDDKWDQRFMEIARSVATWSKDPSTKVGAVIVSPCKRKIAVGYNGFPRGFADYEIRLNHRPTKHMFMQHAERNAMDNCTFDMKDAALYVTAFPCHDCAKSVIQVGIQRVIVPSESILPGWEQSMDCSKTMFAEVNVHWDILGEPT